MTPFARAAAQRIYFHRRGGSPESFETWSEAFASGEMEPLPPHVPGGQLRCI